MKNFLVKALYHIHPEKIDYVTSGKMLVNNLQYYQEMHRLSVESYKKNLLGDWEFIELSGEITGLQTAFRNTMIEIKKIWHENYPCNIFYNDCDTLCVKPLEIFGRFPEFRLFSSRQINLNGYFNCGVRYYPSTADKNIWKVQDELKSNWEEGKYNYEQEIYNAMVWSQKSLRLSFNQLFQDDVAIHGKFKIEEIEEISKKHSIIHFLSSTRPRESVKIMTHAWLKVNNRYKEL